MFHLVPGLRNEIASSAFLVALHLLMLTYFDFSFLLTLSITAIKNVLYFIVLFTYLIKLFLRAMKIGSILQSCSCYR